MKLKMEAVYGSNKSRKSVTLDIPEEVAAYFIGEFKKANEGASSALVEGSAAMKINMSLLHAQQRF